MNTFYASPLMASSLLDDLLENGIKPFADDLAEIAAKGELAVVVYKPRRDDESIGRLIERFFKKKRVVNGLASMDHANAIRFWNSKHFDEVTVRWATRPRMDSLPIFVITGMANFLVNWDFGKGYSFEPGSLDGEKTSRPAHRSLALVH